MIIRAKTTDPKVICELRSFLLNFFYISKKMKMVKKINKPVTTMTVVM